MNIESKIWKYSNTGTTVHAFDGVIALCRPSITRFASNAGIDFCEAQTHRICTRCVAKFNAILETAETETATETATDLPLVPELCGQNVAGPYTCGEVLCAQPALHDGEHDTDPNKGHPDAGTYTPMDGDEYLKVQGLYVVAEVHTDGTYAVFAQSQRIDRGRLNGTEGSLMRFFTNIARLWSARIDDERAQEAARRAEAEYAHHAEADPALSRSPEQIAALIEALGGRFHRMAPNSPGATISVTNVIEAVRNAYQYGYEVEMQDNAKGHEYPWHVSLINRHGATRVQYHYMGH